jgi:hypothetical protein
MLRAVYLVEVAADDELLAEAEAWALANSDGEKWAAVVTAANRQRGRSAASQGSTLPTYIVFHTRFCSMDSPINWH